MRKQPVLVNFRSRKNARSLVNSIIHAPNTKHPKSPNSKDSPNINTYIYRERERERERERGSLVYGVFLIRGLGVFSIRGKGLDSGALLMSWWDPGWRVFKGFCYKPMGPCRSWTSHERKRSALRAQTPKSTRRPSDEKLEFSEGQRLALELLPRAAGAGCPAAQRLGKAAWPGLVRQGLP